LWRRRLPVRPEIALLAAALVVLLLGAIGAARVIIRPAPSGAPRTSSGEVAPLSAPSDQATATSPAAPAHPGASTKATASQRPQPVIEKRFVTETRAIAFATRTVRDNTLAKGTRTVRTSGVPGVRTLTYEVTLTDGLPTAKKLVRSVVTKEPVTEVIAVGTKPGPRRPR
jgi:resuscitation-promoting factor RpfB